MKSEKKRVKRLEKLADKTALALSLLEVAYHDMGLYDFARMVDGHKRSISGSVSIVKEIMKDIKND